MAIEARAGLATAAVDSIRMLVSSPRRQVAVALIIYSVLSLEFFGVYALPHLGRVCVCGQPGNDPATYMWFMAWWPHALLHGINPFFTSSLFSPNRLDLGAATLVPGAALLMTPVTLLFGPLVSYNLVALASPVLAGLFAFLLCRYVSKSFPAALIGGYLFGFTAYMLGQMLGHLNLVLVFPIPAGVHLVLRLTDGRIPTRRFVVLMALDLAVLITFSTELAFTFVVIGALAIGLAAALAPSSRRRLAAAVRPTVLAAALAVIVTSPFIFYALKSNSPGTFAGTGDLWGGDLLGFLIPTRVTWLGSSSFSGISAKFNGNDVLESGIYLGVPLALIIASYIITRWRLEVVRVLSVLLFVLMVLILGSHLHVNSNSTISLPWRALAQLPFIKEALPLRLGVYMFLIAAVLVSMWIAVPRSGKWAVAKWSAVAVAIAFVFPNLGSGLWHTDPANPRFFTTTEYRRYVRPGETVLALPFNGNGMLWQADTGIWFRLAGGNLTKLFPANYFQHEPIVSSFYNPPSFSQAEMLSLAPALRGFLVSHRVGAVVVDPANSQQWPVVLAKLGMTPIRTGGVLLFQVPPNVQAAA